MFFLVLICAFQLNAQTNIKTMFYNTLNYNSDVDSRNRTHHLQTILEDVQPDLFLICEIKNEAASNHLYVNAVLPYKESFRKAPFFYSKSPATGLMQMAYYNSEKLILENTSVIPTETRDINHYTFKINTNNADINPIRIEVFVTHLKASRGEANRLKRYASSISFTRELNNLPKNSYVLFAGDFNFYTSNEEGFLNIIRTSNPINIVDPIDRLCPNFPVDGKDYFDENNYNSTYFWNKSSFADVHSQSTRSYQLNNDGAGGGMDDRFDFIMMSENFKTNSNLYYVNDSYKAVGNNGNCYNSYVSNSNCNGSFSQELRNALYQFSDHLPIVMNIETPQNTLSIQEKNNFTSFLKSNIISNYLTLKMTEKVNSIIIYNQLGQIVFKTNNINTNELEIDTNTFSKGVHYLKADSSKPLKFVKI